MSTVNNLIYDLVNLREMGHGDKKVFIVDARNGVADRVHSFASNPVRAGTFEGGDVLEEDTETEVVIGTVG